MKTSKPNKKKVILILWGFLLSIIVIVFLTILLLSLQSKPSNKQEPVSNVKTNSQQEQETYNRLMNKIEKEIDDLTKPSKKNTEEILVKEIKELKNQRLTLSALYFSVGRTGNLEKQKEVIQKMDKIDKLIEEKNQKIILIEQDKEEIKSTEKSDSVASRQRG